MGKHVNSRVYQTCAWIIAFAVTAIIVAMFIAQAKQPDTSSAKNSVNHVSKYALRLSVH
ncbi:MAG TPA: hypothetical protein VGF44_03360 [Terriglobales bacterium]|jgi:hypothetical protein